MKMFLEAVSAWSHGINYLVRARYKHRSIGTETKDEESGHRREGGEGREGS